MLMVSNQLQVQQTVLSHVAVYLSYAAVTGLTIHHVI